MKVNQEMKKESNWMWLILEQMDLRLEFASENQGEAESLKQCNDQRTD